MYLLEIKEGFCGNPVIYAFAEVTLPSTLQSMLPKLHLSAIAGDW
jgi:hypothetical protein